jgi:hypothetical protein
MPGNAGSAAEVDPPVPVSSSVVVGLVLAVALLAGCAGSGGIRPPGPCGDQCATMTCPGGTHCQVTSSCVPVCLQDPLSPR